MGQHELRSENATKEWNNKVFNTALQWDGRFIMALWERWV
jgi:hypothetical protein